MEVRLLVRWVNPEHICPDPAFTLLQGITTSPLVSEDNWVVCRGQSLRDTLEKIRSSWVSFICCVKAVLKEEKAQLADFLLRVLTEDMSGEGNYYKKQGWNKANDFIVLPWKGCLFFKAESTHSSFPFCEFKLHLAADIYLHDCVGKFSFPRLFWAQVLDTMTSGRLCSLSWILLSRLREPLHFLTSLTCSSFSLSQIGQLEPAQLSDQRQGEHMGRISRSDIWKHLTSNNSDI